MSEIDPKVLAALGRLSASVKDLDPRIRRLLEQLEHGVSQEQVLADLIKLVAEDSALARRIEEAARTEFQPLRKESVEDIAESVTALRKLKDRQDALRDLNFEEEDLVFHPEGTGLPQLHPVVMGYIIERLQFDDDIPELRTGSLPVGAPPAVPVETTVRDPAVLGAQLERASQEVREELDDAQREKMKELEGLEPELLETALVPQGKEKFLAVSEGRVGVPGYQAGHKADLRRVVLDDQALVHMTEDLRRKYAHKALTSTQGRRSAVPVIGALIQKELVQKGYEVTLDGPETLLETPIAQASWVLTIDAAVEETQGRFSFIDNAAKALSTHLERALAENGVLQILLHIQPINDIAKRRVGWEAKAVACQ